MCIKDARSTQVIEFSLMYRLHLHPNAFTRRERTCASPQRSVLAEMKCSLSQFLFTAPRLLTEKLHSFARAFIQEHVQFCHYFLLLYLLCHRLLIVLGLQVKQLCLSGFECCAQKHKNTVRKKERGNSLDFMSTINSECFVCWRRAKLQTSWWPN